MEDYVKADLVNLIKDLTGEDKLSPMIQGQIQRYVLELGMSFKEIARCLVYWVEVKGQSLSPAYGIGIVPTIRKPAADYFKQLELEREEQVKQAKKAIEYEENNIIFNIRPGRIKKRKIPQLDLNEIDLGDGDEDGR